MITNLKGGLKMDKEDLEFNLHMIWGAILPKHIQEELDKIG